MASPFLTLCLFLPVALFSSQSGLTGWEDVVVAREGTPTTLVCIDPTLTGDVAINWKVKSPGADEWELVLSANNRKEFSGAASKASMKLTDENFQNTGNFSLVFLPRMQDGGLYSCLIKQQTTLRERIILLAVLRVTVVPPAPVPQRSTLRLIASVTPDSAIAKITWLAPGDISLKSEKMSVSGTVAKRPQVLNDESGLYVCVVQPLGDSSTAPFLFSVDVTVADKVVSFSDTTHGKLISTACQAQRSFILTCPDSRGDYVELYWQRPNTRRNMTKLYEYDRWRGYTYEADKRKNIRLAGSPYNAEAGSFSFLLSPEFSDGGLYICNVFLNDNPFSQATKLSVLKVSMKAKPASSEMELGCLYTNLPHVQKAAWKYQNKSHKLEMFSSYPGSIKTTVPLPVTRDTAGNYTCTLRLRNGRTVFATLAVKETVTTPSLPPSLSALLLLVPLVAAAVGVLLWRQKHISDRGIEQSLSAHSGDAENIYENPEVMRQQTPPEGPVYMDLKPRGEDDVYKELERYEECQS